jgi:hypothetical protein
MAVGATILTSAASAASAAAEATAAPLLVLEAASTPSLRTASAAFRAPGRIGMGTSTGLSPSLAAPAALGTESLAAASPAATSAAPSTAGTGPIP